MVQAARTIERGGGRGRTVAEDIFDHRRKPSVTSPAIPSNKCEGRRAGILSRYIGIFKIPKMSDAKPQPLKICSFKILAGPDAKMDEISDANYVFRYCTLVFTFLLRALAQRQE